MFRLIIFLILFSFSFGSFGFGGKFLHTFMSFFGNVKGDVVSGSDTDSDTDTWESIPNAIDETDICTNNSPEYLNGLHVANANKVIEREIKKFKNRELTELPKLKEQFNKDIFRAQKVIIDEEDVTKKIKGASQDDQSDYFKDLVSEEENQGMTRINQQAMAGNVGVFKAALRSNVAANNIDIDDIVEENPGDEYHFNKTNKTCELTHVIKYSKKYKCTVNDETIDVGKAELGELQYKGTYDYQKGIPLSGNVAIQNSERKFIFNRGFMERLERLRNEIR